VDKVDEYLDLIDHLPPAPMLVMELLAQFKQPDRDMDRVVELITHDPSLTAQLLKLCNSAYYASGRPVESVFDAVMRVGFYEIYRMVASVFGCQTMALSGVERALPVNELWRHSVSVAVAAETVARQVSEDEATAFTAALLHDIGKVILAVAASDVYGRLREKGPAGAQTMMEAEKAMLGVDHAEVGARLLARWNLPTHLVVAVRCHHDPTRAAPFERLAASVHLANVISYQLSPQSESTHEFQNPVTSLHILGLTPEIYPLLVGRTKGGLERSKPLLEM
jgi:putative nucleotidyltransferase with HDIG domain